MSAFKKKYDFNSRKEESAKILKKYTDKCPIIVENSKKSTLEKLDKCKFLVPNDLTIAQFMVVLRKRIKISNEESFFLFINDNILVSSSQTVSNVYSSYKNEDGFLYLTYCNENTFGKR